MIDAMEKIGHNKRWSWNDERVRAAPRADGTRSSVRLECHSRNRTAIITSRDDAECAFCALQIRLSMEGANSQLKTSLLKKHLKEIATPEESDSEMTEERVRTNSVSRQKVPREAYSMNDGALRSSHTRTESTRVPRRKGQSAYNRPK